MSLTSNDNTSISKKWTQVDSRALKSVAGQFFINGFAMGTYVPRLPQLRDQINVNIDNFGLILASSSVIAILASFFVGKINKVFGTRTVIIWGGIFMISALPLIGASLHPITLILALGLFLSSDAIIDVSMNLQGSWLNSRRHQPIMNRLHALWSLGTLTGGFVASRAAIFLTPLQHFLLTSIILSIAVVIISSGLLKTDQINEHSSNQVSKPNKIKIFKSLAPFTIAGAATIIIEILPLDWSAFRLSDDLHAPPGIATLGFVAATLGMTSARFIGDFVINRISTKKILIINISSISIGLILFALINNQIITILGSFLIGFGAATILPKLYDDAAKRKGLPGAGIGALTTGIRIASLITPILIGTIAIRSSVGTALILVGGIGIIVLVAVLRLVKTNLSDS